MRKKLISLGVVSIMCFAFSASAFASYIMRWDFELYNRPYAESIALSMAQAQQALEEEPLGRLEIFEDMLTRQLLYRITRNVIDEAFGEDALEPGHYVVGNYVIDISTDGELITIVITDTLTGDTTTIEVPYYDY